MGNEQQRHDISDGVWALLEPYMRLGGEDNGAGLPGTTGSLSTACSGFCEPGRRGGIYRLAMESGAQYTSGFADGGTRGFGRNCLRYWWMSLILNG